MFKWINRLKERKQEKERNEMVQDFIWKMRDFVFEFDFKNNPEYIKEIRCYSYEHFSFVDNSGNRHQFRFSGGLQYDLQVKEAGYIPSVSLTDAEIDIVDEMYEYLKKIEDEYREEQYEKRLSVVKEASTESIKGNPLTVKDMLNDINTD